MTTESFHWHLMGKMVSPCTLIGSLSTCRQPGQAQNLQWVWIWARSNLSLRSYIYHWLWTGKMVSPSFLSYYEFSLTFNKDRHKILGELNFGRIWPVILELCALEHKKNEVSSFSQSPLIGSLSNLQVSRTCIKARIWAGSDYSFWNSSPLGAEVFPHILIMEKIMSPLFIS